MPKIPVVAIIGKPNTGKSTLFNRFAGRRKAIVTDTPGTTRDHIAHFIEGEEADFTIVDTGGMGGGTEDKDLEDDVHRQSLIALENADIIILTLDSRTALTGSDFEIVSILRKKKKKHVPVIVAVTKCDDPGKIDQLLPEFYGIGIGDHVIALSSIQKIGIERLRSAIEQELVKLHFGKAAQTPSSAPKIAIIGKPNVGKSSMVNAFMSEAQRSVSPLLVSDIAGTTRDTTDTVIRYHDKEFIFMDTAGIKRRNQTEGEIEVNAYFRSVKALQMCDVAVLVLDAREPVSKQERRIAGMAVDEGKGIIVALNKADMVEKEELEERIKYLKHELPFCRYAPILACSAVTKQGLLKLFDMIDAIQRNRVRRIAVKDLRQWFEDAVFGQPMRHLEKTKHLTQADGVPPTFVLFVKNPKHIEVSQLRYLDNRLRETFDFAGTPVRFIAKGEDDDRE